MKKYIGTKVIMAVLMTLGDYNIKRGWTIPTNEDPNREGYFVEYPDGYVSWSPKEVFEEAYRETNGGLTFGSAIEALKKGLRVARNGWNGKGMFIFMRPADDLNIEFLVDKVKSLPQSVKTFYLQDIVNEKGERIPVEETDMVKFTAYLCLKAADGTVVNGWLASQTDILAEDWCILD
jgi:hypothetical protein